jgi:hypothetical protein
LGNYPVALIEKHGDEALENAVQKICSYWVGPPKPSIALKEDFYRYFDDNRWWDDRSCPVWGF